MGWSTQIVVVNKRDNEKFTWELFTEHSLELIRWNKLYLLRSFPDINKSLVVYSLLQKNGEDTGWEYIELDSNLISDLLKPENIKLFIDKYTYYRPFKNKTEQSRIIKEYKDALKTALHIIKWNHYYCKIYIIEG